VQKNSYILCSIEAILKMMHFPLTHDPLRKRPQVNMVVIL